MEYEARLRMTLATATQANRKRPGNRGRFTGDRKDGMATAHVARQYLGSVDKVDNGIVAVTSLSL
jgi:hypothetical protein